MMNESQALVTVDDGPTDYVKNIMRQIIAPNTRKNYIGNNVLFLLWLYDEENLREELLQDWFYETMHQCKREDDECERSVLRKKQREYCKVVLQEISKDGNNCPVILCKLSFSLFSHYVSTRRNGDGSLKSKASYGGIRSALMDLYRCSGCEMSDEFAKDLTTFMGGIKREVIRERISKGLVFDEGKRPMSYEVYKHLCESLSKSDDIEDIFCHLFLVLEWNLMARSENCLLMSLTHVQWRNDSLVFFFGKTKRNQEGDGNHHPWHVYSNTFEPALCPVLTFGKYLLAYPQILLDERGPVFPGASQYSRFSKRLGQILHREHSNLASLGVDPKDYGSHSVRKGAISLVSAGCTVSPPMAAICLRAAWSMGNVKDRYIHYEKAGDEFVGRSVSGISSLSHKFAASPIYFEPGCIDDNDYNGSLDEDVEKLISETYVKKEEISSSTFSMFKYIVASICFNYSYLDSTLSNTHCIRSNPLFVALGDNNI